MPFALHADPSHAPQSATVGGRSPQAWARLWIAPPATPFHIPRPLAVLSMAVRGHGKG